jgi:hypothetical protein
LREEEGCGWWHSDKKHSYLYSMGRIEEDSIEFKESRLEYRAARPDMESSEQIHKAYCGVQPFADPDTPTAHSAVKKHKYTSSLCLGFAVAILLVLAPKKRFAVAI